MPHVAYLDWLVVWVLGTLFGSFANVCIYRVPRQLSVIFPGSHCPTCQTALRPRENIPVLSYLWQGGRCTTCDAVIGRRYPLIELLNGGLFLVLYSHYHWSMESLVYALLTTALLVVTCIDLTHTIIPDSITLPGILIGLGASTWLTSVGWQRAWVGAVLSGGLFVLIAVLSVVVLGREGMGGGDIKLITMLGAFLGWQAVLVTIFLAAMIGASVGIGQMLVQGWRRHAALPFGPFLALGAFLAMLWGEALITWYMARAFPPL